MAAPGSVIDGNPGYGSFVATFSISGDYIVESFDVQRPVSTARDRKVDGEPGRSRYTNDFTSATAVLQAPTGTSGYPIFGETFTHTLDANYGPETWIMMPPNVPISNDPSTLRKINVTFQKQNCLTVTTSPALPPAN